MEDQVTVQINPNENIIQQINDKMPKNVECISVEGAKEPIAKARVALKAAELELGWCTLINKIHNGNNNLCVTYYLELDYMELSGEEVKDAGFDFS
ncbi:hypothetical protein N9N97_00055 [Rickettsiaceae bacterium]|nr:hypothetical protein [Rickettsiaceae bacterium]